MSRLVVFHQEKVVGHLEFDEEERLSFQYAVSWLGDSNRFPLSLALALVEKRYGHRETKAFFENLLPEGEIKDLVEAHGKSSLRSEFGFLREFGGDCAGALQILPETVKVPKAGKARKELSVEVIYKYLEEKKSLADAVLNLEGGKFSLAGAQDKFAVILVKERLYLPLDGSPTTHIIKPHVRYFRSTHDTPYNEYFCMRLAARIGLQVPAVDLIAGEYPLFIVERFDRVMAGGKVHRVHQQDFCQAQGITSLKKYESDGGPSFAANYKLLKAYSSAPIPDLSQLLKWLVFNLVIGNNDSHSKNLALLQTAEGLRLAPFYDLLSTSVYKEIGQNFAFKIGGQDLWFKLKGRMFEKLASELDLKDEMLAKLALRVLADTQRELPVLLGEFNERFPGVKTGEVLEKEILKRTAFFNKIFTS